MNPIRKATVQDVSRIAEILIFTKRMNYRFIFQNDKVSFGELQVLPLAQDYLSHPEKLKHIWVYDDEFVKALIHVEDGWIHELYVDCFFQNEGIGGKLLQFAVETFDAKFLFVLEKMRAPSGFMSPMALKRPQNRKKNRGRRNLS